MPNAAKCGWGPPSPPLHRPDRFPALFRLLVCATGVIHVVTAQSVGPRITIMKTFTIDEQNNITAFGTQEEAAATTTTPFDSFASQKDLADLAAGWPAERLVAIWNSLPGVKPVKSFKNAKAGASRIWECIQGLGDAPKPESKPAKPKADKKAKGGAQAAKGAPAKAEEGAGPREGSKTAQVVATLQRKNGATLEEIMEKMGWQRHTVRGMMAGSLKKAGYAVESFKSDNGERPYRINQ